MSSSNPSSSHFAALRAQWEHMHENRPPNNRITAAMKNHMSQPKDGGGHGLLPASTAQQTCQRADLAEHQPGDLGQQSQRRGRRLSSLQALTSPLNPFHKRRQHHTNQQQIQSLHTVPVDLTASNTSLPGHNQSAVSTPTTATSATVESQPAMTPSSRRRGRRGAVWFAVERAFECRHTSQDGHQDSYDQRSHHSCTTIFTDVFDLELHNSSKTSPARQSNFVAYFIVCGGYRHADETSTE
ncbi:hypothetical protein BDY21DRAFT_371484 [Lineolata rhizophorae]|uniref:Uncharacterized protein n=1 Tax=Lineolata rhizophorae TaxID=578093 RepID=A0A6A6P246_9PEZI|nr:hypothetical protein BDY21DRAFT_371484 [Lineolata rhizophorae]